MYIGVLYIDIYMSICELYLYICNTHVSVLVKSIIFYTYVNKKVKEIRLLKCPSVSLSYKLVSLVVCMKYPVYKII